MKRILTLVFTFLFLPSLFASDLPALKLSPEKTKRIAFFGGDFVFTLGDYTEVHISPLVGFYFSKQISGGVKFIYSHSWQKTNIGTVNETTLQNNDFGGNVFLKYSPVDHFYLKSEFSYQSYKFSTTQSTNEKKYVPFLFIGGGYTQYLNNNVFFDAGLKVDILNNENSPFNDFTPFFELGIGIDI